MNTNELASIIIALIALIVSFTAIIQQLKYSIISQLSHIAGIKNSYIINGEFLKDEAGISAVFSNLIISSQIIEMHYDNGMTRFWMFFINKETIKDNFYLILHTTIRDFIKKKSHNCDISYS